MRSHVSGSERVGFSKARRSWEPSSSSTTGTFSPFRTLRKASAVNVRWTDYDSYLSFSQKSSSWHFLALARLRSTAQEWNHQRISNSWNKVDCCLSDDSFLAHASLQGDSAALPRYEYFAAGFPSYPCHMAFIACLMTAFFALHSRVIVRTFLATMLYSGIFNMRKVILFKVLLSLRKVVHFQNFLRTWLPRRPSLVGADTSTESGRFQAQILVNQKKGILGLGHTKPCLRWSHLVAFLGLFLFYSFSSPLLVAIDQPWRT